MSKDAPSAPAQPSPQAVAAANQQTALWNASLSDVNQSTPLGSIKYTPIAGTGMTTDTDAYNAAMKAWEAGQGAAPTRTTGENPQAYQQQLQQYNQLHNQAAPSVTKYQHDTGVPPQYQSDVTLSPQMQQLLNTTEQNQNSLATTAGGLMGQIQSQASHPIDYSKFSPVPGQGDLQTMQKSSLDAQMQQLQPLFDQQNERQNSDLLNQGLTQGSQAWNNSWRETNDSQNNARLQAINNAAQYGAQMDQTALGNRNQQINEAYQQQNAPINQYTALMGQTQVQTPQFGTAPNAQNPAASVPAGGNALEQNYAQQMQAYNAQLQSQNQMTSSLFGLGGTLGAAYMLA